MRKVSIFIVILCLCVTVFASGSTVIDNAGVLSDDQRYDLAAQLEALQNTYQIDVVILTEPTLHGISPMIYADDFYDYEGYSADGLLLLLDMEERQWYISTSGSCMSSIDVDAMAELFLPYLREGEYHLAFMTFAKMVDAMMQQPEGEFVYTIGNYGEIFVAEEEIPWYHGLWQCLLICAVIGLIVVGIMAFKMKNVRSKGGAGDYVKTGSLRLICEEDRFLYQTVTRRPKANNNSNGVHRGSSGRSHGGGGGRF